MSSGRLLLLELRLPCRLPAAANTHCTILHSFATFALLFILSVENIMSEQASKLLTLTQDNLLHWVTQGGVAAVIFIVGWFSAKWTAAMLGKALERGGLDSLIIDFLSAVTRTLIIVAVIIAALSSLGVDTTSLVALLGAAGLAVGLALKDSLQNFASGVMLVIFRPFKKGDFVEVAGVAGTVQKIQIFSSQLLTPDNKTVIVPNGAIYGDVITNFSAQDTRRVDMVFGIGYDDDLLVAKKLLNDIVSSHNLVLKDPEPVVALSELADSSVNFIVRPWVKREDYWTVKAELTEQVKLQFDASGISIPYPQQDVHLYAKEAAGK